MKPRIWALHGMHKLTDDPEGRTKYSEGIIGPPIGDTVIQVIEFDAFECAPGLLQRLWSRLECNNGPYPIKDPLWLEVKQFLDTQSPVKGSNGD